MAWKVFQELAYRLKMEEKTWKYTRNDCDFACCEIRGTMVSQQTGIWDFGNAQIFVIVSMMAMTLVHHT